MLLRHGRDWAAIASYLPNKTDSQCKNFYHNNKRRLGLEQVLAKHQRLVSTCQPLCLRVYHRLCVGVYLIRTTLYVSDVHLFLAQKEMSLIDSDGELADGVDERDLDDEHIEELFKKKKVCVGGPAMVVRLTWLHT